MYKISQNGHGHPIHFLPFSKGLLCCQWRRSWHGAWKGHWIHCIASAVGGPEKVPSEMYRYSLALAAWMPMVLNGNRLSSKLHLMVLTPEQITIIQRIYLDYHADLSLSALSKTWFRDLSEVPSSEALQKGFYLGIPCMGFVYCLCSERLHLSMHSNEKSLWESDTIIFPWHCLDSC